MKEFQIEKVNHSQISYVDTVCLISYYPAWDELVQTNFATEDFARTCIGKLQIGMWKPKQQKLNH